MTIFILDEGDPEGWAPRRQVTTEHRCRGRLEAIDRAIISFFGERADFTRSTGGQEDLVTGFLVMREEGASFSYPVGRLMIEVEPTLDLIGDPHSAEGPIH